MIGPFTIGTYVWVKGVERKKLMDTTTMLGANERVDE